jgi:ATP-binding cassette subfamily F protein uup
MALARIQNGSLAFGHVALLDDVELIIEPRERLCLIGRNGTGKSTLLNVIAGEMTLDGGSLWYRDGLKIAKLAQEVPDAEAATLYEVVAAGLGDHSDLLARYHQASHDLAEGDTSERALETLGRLQNEVESAGAWEGSQRIDATLSRLALPEDARMSECSGGIRRRAMLGQALVGEPDLLLLDEPTNHLDIESITSLEEALLGYSGTVVFITHDRALIGNLATRIIELDRGALRSYPGSYERYQARKASELAAEADGDRKFDKTLAQEEVWIRQGIKARRTRNEGRVRRLESLRGERAERRNRQGNVRMQLASSESSGKLVVEAEGVGFGYEAEPVVRDFSTLVLRGDRIGIIGRNGSGKSTLLKLLLGELDPSVGSIRRGTRLNIAYFDQERGQLDPERSVRDNLAEGSDQITIDGKTRHVISYLGDFLFPPARTNSPVKTLSGGERNRLLLARLFSRPANLLVLDEPTNDLDVETLELLEELLLNYQGTLLLVSHDRSFLDRTVTSTLVLDGSGRVGEFVGGYSDWLHQQSAQRVSKKRAKVPAQEAVVTQQKKSKGSRKISYKEQQELESLPELIESLEAELNGIQDRTASPGFYQQSKEVVAEAMKALADIEARLEQAYARWAEMDG